MTGFRIYVKSRPTVSILLREKFNLKGGKKYVHHVLPTGDIPAPEHKEGKRKCDAWEFHYAGC